MVGLVRLAFRTELSLSKLLAIIDIDGTLADISELSGRVGAEPSRHNKEIYRAWASQMTETLADLSPNAAVFESVRTLYRGGAVIAYLTSREHIHEQTTRAWLARYGAPPGPLYMRGYNDWRSTADMKGAVVYELKKKHVGPVLAIDDDRDGSVSPTYKALGVSHLKAVDNL
jgi:hypothetical protein